MWLSGALKTLGDPTDSVTRQQPFQLLRISLSFLVLSVIIILAAIDLATWKENSQRLNSTSKHLRQIMQGIKSTPPLSLKELEKQEDD